MTIIVVSRRRKQAGGPVVYVGRPSPLGNPFVMKSEADRERVITQYAGWLANRIIANDTAVCGELTRLKELEQQAGTLYLECWCAPLPCHADIIAKQLSSWYPTKA